MEKNKKIHYELEYHFPNCDRQQFFDLFVDHEAWTKSELLPEVQILSPGEGHPMGQGAARLVISGNMKIEEDIIGFDSPRYFAYATRNGSLPVNDFGGELFLEEKDGGVLAKYKGGFNPRYFGTGWILKVLFSTAQKSAFKNLEKVFRNYYNI